MTNRFYVYVHRRESDGKVFYVGKGSHKDRMLEVNGRNQYWKNVVAKHGFIAEVVARFDSDFLSQQLERELIAWFGKSNLTNLTDGGDGCAGLIVSDSARKKLSFHASKPRSEAWIQSIRESRKNGGNGGVVKRGDKLPESWKESLAKAKVGPKNPMYGKTGASHHLSRPVIHIQTGVFFDSIQDAADSFGLKMKTLYNFLSGHRRNNTGLEFA